jgi:hypothetical protein
MVFRKIVQMMFYHGLGNFEIHFFIRTECQFYFIEHQMMEAF